MSYRVDNAGNIYYQGEPINRFYIEGLNMLSGNYKVATQNISADDVTSVSVYERHQPIKALKNVEFSDKAALNLKIKENRKLKPIGYLAQLMGHEKKAIGKTDGFGLRINRKSQQLLSLKANNIGDTYNTTNSILDRGISDFSSFTWKGIALAGHALPDISLDRYVDNTSGKADLNTIFQLKGDQTLAVNIIYGGEKLRYSNRQNASVFLADNSYKNVSEAMSAGIYSHNVKAKVKYELNNDRLFLQNNTVFDGTFYHKHFDIDGYFVGIQRQKSANYQVSNAFSSVLRTKKHVLQFSSNMYLSNTPVNRLSVLSADSIWPMRQNLNETAWQTDEHTSWSWLISSVALAGLNLDFQSLYNRVELDRHRHASDCMNAFQGYRLITTASPYMQFKWKRLTWRLNAPLSMLNMHISNIRDDKQFRQNKPYASVNTLLDWDLRHGLSVSLSGGTRHRFGDIANFIVDPIFINYKEASTSGTGLLTNRHSLFATIGGTYRQVSRGIFVSLRANMLRARVNSMRSTTLEGQDFVEHVDNRRNTLTDQSITLNMSKSIHSTNTSLNFLGAMGHTATHILSVGRAIGLENRRYNVLASAEQSLFDDRVNLSLQYSFMRSENELQGHSTSMFTHSGSYSLSVFVLKDLELLADMHQNWIRNTAYHKHETYLNAGIRYKKKRYEMELMARNITNLKEYTINRQMQEDSYVYTYMLRPASYAVSFRFNF